MSRRAIGTILLMVLAGGTPRIEAHAGHAHEGPDARKVLARLLALEGDWSGMTVGPDASAGARALRVIYRRAGGAVLEELADPGTDHETVTRYRLEGHDLVLAGDSARGSRPPMKLVDLHDRVLYFEQEATPRRLDPSPQWDGTKIAPQAHLPEATPRRLDSRPPGSATRIAPQARRMALRLVDEHRIEIRWTMDDGQRERGDVRWTLERAGPPVRAPRNP